MDVPASGLRGLDIDGDDGGLTVRVGRDETVRARVSLGGGCDRAAGYAATASRSGGELRMSVQPSTKDKCDEVWTVDLPARFAVSGTFDRGDVVIDGPAGGVDLHLGRGTVRISVPHGDLRAAVDNGDVMVRSATSSYGDVALESTVGEVEISIDGGALRHTRPPGAGDRFAIDGSGRDRISLRSTVGDVRLRIR